MFPKLPTEKNHNAGDDEKEVDRITCKIFIQCHAGNMISCRRKRHARVVRIGADYHNKLFDNILYACIHLNTWGADVKRNIPQNVRDNVLRRNDRFITDATLAVLSL